jgi:uncharacterized protein YggE
VVLRDLDHVGELLAAVVEAGANSISEVSFTVEDSEALVEQARQQALEDAGARAKQMAEGLGITLGKPILVMETGGGYPVPMELGLGGGGGGVAEAAVPSISPGTFSVSVSVQVIYEIRLWGGDRDRPANQAVGLGDLSSLRGRSGGDQLGTSGA